MKKLLLSAVAASFLLVSCGPDLCECVNEKGDKPSEKCKELMDKTEKEWKEADDAKKKEMEKEIEACSKDEKKDDKKEE